jgi:aerobic-type carbon monoxide dehydrogenase small subunit (CoxS/CutS family)
VSARMPISVSVNGATVRAEVEPRTLLVDFLRDDCGLTGTKIACEDGTCGACTVLLSGKTMRSCLLFAVQASDEPIETIEGLSDNGSLGYLQDTFRSSHALQCGFCVAGMLLTAHELRSEKGELTEEEAREALSGVLCRCTGYHNIVQAVLRSVPPSE